ncbi:MAG: hypothetical protein ACYTAF_07355 [Planctomycetota bacterium]|jgi:hypothetical protein
MLAEAMDGKQKLGVVAIIVVVVIVVVLVALLTSAFLGGRRLDREISCVGIMAQLWKMQQNYAVVYGGPGKSYPTATGPDFWLALTRTDPPLIDDTLRDLFTCPVRGKPAGKGRTHYRGPASDVNRYPDGDPVGADYADNHSEDGSEGGNVLRKSGDIQTVGGDSMLWRRTFSVLEGGPRPKGLD